MNAKELFTNLAIVANIDGDLALQERLLLDQYAKKLKIGFLDAQKILDQVKAGQLQKFTKPKRPKARRSLYKAMIKIVRSDNKITQNEQKVLKRIGNLLEIDDELMARATATMPPTFDDDDDDDVIEL
ncbi:MAG: TerB family tellurite resistance protein [Planctomycetota bacterium]|nr:TerB family tellurite resistance protein [Planctomycetota bacterium]